MANNNLILDDGFLFGLGAFETILIKNGQAVFLSEHLQRLKEALKFLEIDKRIDQIMVEEFIAKNKVVDKVLKLIVSQDNFLMTLGDIPYTEKDYKRGMRLKISKILRNESSPFTFIKSLNYADNILEKRKVKDYDYDEPVFLNTKGQIAEGATSNIFFVKNGSIYTPKLECGLLNGTVRKYVMNNYDVIETIIFPSMVKDYDEIFITNSLLGIMPIIKFEDIELDIGQITCQISKKYNSDIIQ